MSTRKEDFCSLRYNFSFRNLTLFFKKRRLNDERTIVHWRHNCGSATSQTTSCTYIHEIPVSYPSQETVIVFTRMSRTHRQHCTPAPPANESEWHNLTWIRQRLNTGPSSTDSLSIIITVMHISMPFHCAGYKISTIPTRKRRIVHLFKMTFFTIGYSGAARMRNTRSVTFLSQR